MQCQDYQDIYNNVNIKFIHSMDLCTCIVYITVLSINKLQWKGYYIFHLTIIVLHYKEQLKTMNQKWVLGQNLGQLTIKFKSAAEMSACQSSHWLVW
jgi:hypothetical protein